MTVEVSNRKDQIRDPALAAAAWQGHPLVRMAIAEVDHLADDLEAVHDRLYSAIKASPPPVGCSAAITHLAAAGRHLDAALMALGGEVIDAPSVLRHDLEDK